METKSVILRTLTPLFIKGKDPSYGEGMLRGNDKQIYLIDNDELCNYLLKKNKIEEYIAYYYRPKGHNDHVGFAKIYGINITQHLYDCAPLANDENRKYRSIDDEIDGRPINTSRFLKLLCDRFRGNRLLRPDMTYELYKKYSLKFFLDFYRCIPNDCDLKGMAKGIMPLNESQKSKKFFIQDVDGNYYIPGSSIKGAVRNALLWSLMEDASNNAWLNGFVYRNISNDLVNSIKPSFLIDKNDNKMVGDDDKTLYLKSGFIQEKDEIPDIDQEYSLRWKDTNDQLRDIFKALKISDSSKLVVDSTYNTVVTAVCMLRSSGKYLYMKDFDIELHAIPSSIDIPFTITLDIGMLKRMYGDRMPICLSSIDKLLETVSHFFNKVYLYERNFFDGTQPAQGGDGYDGCQETQEFYNQKIEHLFRFGWGGGLMTKTQFLLLNELYVTSNVKMNLRKTIRDRYTGKKRSNSNDAPKSRCLIVGDESFGQPLGWCELVYKKKTYQLGEVVSGTISSFEMVLLEGRKRYRPATVRIERQDTDIPLECDSTSKNEIEAQKLFSEVEVTAIDEKGIVVGVKALIIV